MHPASSSKLVQSLQLSRTPIPPRISPDRRARTVAGSLNMIAGRMSFPCLKLHRGRLSNASQSRRELTSALYNILCVMFPPFHLFLIYPLKVQIYDVVNRDAYVQKLSVNYINQRTACITDGLYPPRDLAFLLRSLIIAHLPHQSFDRPQVLRHNGGLTIYLSFQTGNPLL
jgi:hypothetical protein